MSTVTEIRQAIDSRLATIPGLRHKDVGIASPNPPDSSVNLHGLDYSQDFDGGILATFWVWIYISSTDLARGQRELDSYLSPSGDKSVKEAIESDANLAGMADWVRVTGTAQPPSQPDVAGIKVLAIPLVVLVMFS